ncbi:MAG: heparin lyase I family protein [Myxococcota bacterium]
MRLVGLTLAVCSIHCVGEFDAFDPPEAPASRVARVPDASVDAMAPVVWATPLPIVQTASQTTVENNERPPEPTRSLLWYVGAETGDLLDRETSRFDSGRVHCRREQLEFVAPSLPHSGAMALRFRLDPAVLRSCDLGVFLRNQNRVAVPDGEVGWYSFAFRLPEWRSPSARYQLANIHPNRGGERLRLMITANGHLELTSNRISNFQPLELGSAKSSEWQEVVMRVIVSADADRGRFQMWRRIRGGTYTEVADYRGATTDLGTDFRYHLRVGLMVENRSTEWADPEDVREAFFDEIRVGDASASMREVTPGSGYTIDPARR